MRAFDEQLRKMAQEERWTPSAKARAELCQAMRTGAPHAPGKRRWHLPALAAGLAAAAVLVALAFRPPMDVQTGGLLSTQQQDGFVLADGETPLPVTVPEGKINILSAEKGVSAQATFTNQTADIWLLQWDAQLLADASQTRAAMPLIWLEAGVSFTDQAEWTLSEALPGGQARVEWSYTAYRVTADILQWLDEEWLTPGQEGYEEQQDLIQAAYEARAIILSAGNWPVGSAGEMRLVLPDGCEEEDVLDYYVRIGALEKAQTHREVVAGESTGS